MQQYGIKLYVHSQCLFSRSMATVDLILMRISLSLSDTLRTALCVFIVLSHLIYHQILSLTQPPFTHPATFVFSIPISPSRPISLPLPTSGQKFEISQLTQSIRMVGMVKNPREWWSQKRKELEGTRVPPPPPSPRLPAAFMIPAIVEPLDRGDSFLFVPFTMFVEEVVEWVDLKLDFLATRSFFCLFCLSGR